MNTKEQTSDKTLLQEISDKLQMARQELDEFAVQMALGKAEARDKFEEMKTNFLSRLHELNNAFVAEEKRGDTKRKIDALEAQLYAGGINEQKSFGERMAKILAALESVKNEISKKIKTVEQQVDFDHEVEMFRLKLEILRLKFGLKKFEVKEKFQTQLEHAKKAINSITDKAKEKIDTTKVKYEDFSDEVQLAYKHFRKALEELRN